MDTEAFKRRLAEDQFLELVSSELPAGLLREYHSHAFDVRALVLEGGITLTVDGRSKHYAAGDVFTMTAGVEHREQVDAEGVRYVAGRRYHA